MIDRQSLITPITIKRNRTFVLPKTVSPHKIFVICIDQGSTPCLSVKSYALWKEEKLAEALRYKDFPVAHQEILESIQSPDNYVELDESRVFRFGVDMRKQAKLTKNSLILGSGDRFTIIDCKLYEGYNFMYHSV